MLKFFIIIIYVFQINSKPIFNESQKLLSTLINDLRQSPKSFSKYLDKNFIPLFSHKIYNNKIETIEGPYAFKEATHYLKRLPSRFPLKLNPYFSKIAETHSLSMKSSKTVSHYSEGKTPISILKKKGKIFGKLTQIVTKVKKDIGSLITILAFLIADDGVEDRLNCRAIMYNGFEMIGVGVVEDEIDCYVTVILGDFYEAGVSFRTEIEDYQGLKEELSVLSGDSEALGDLVRFKEGGEGLDGESVKRGELGNSGDLESDKSKDLEVVEKVYEDEDEDEDEGEDEGEEEETESGDNKEEETKSEDNNEMEGLFQINKNETNKDQVLNRTKKDQKIGNNEQKEKEEDLNPEDLDELGDYDLENLFQDNEEDESNKKMLAVKKLYDNLDDLNKTLSTLN